MGTVDSQVFGPLIVNSTNCEPPVRSPKRLKKTNLHTHAWRLVDSVFHSFDALFSFTLEACCNLFGSNRHGLLPIYSEKKLFSTS